MKKIYFFFIVVIAYNYNILGQTSLVKDISTNAKTSSISTTSLGVIFTADDNPLIINNEPHISNGTESGTYKVLEINTNNVLTNASSVALTDNTEFVELNGYIYFAAGNASNNVELWRTDGTTVGTTLVKEINASTASSSNPFNLTVLNGNIIFSANNGFSGNSNGIELWISDGTSAGTVLLKDIYPGTDSSAPSDFVVHDNKIFFTANNGPNGRELWVTDGTPTGTEMVKDFVSGSGSSNPKFTTSFNGDLYFSANGELYKSSGAIGNGAALKNINTTGDSNPSNFKVYNNRLYFTADDGINGRELWRTNGTVFGTQLFKDINPTGSSDANSFSLVNGLLFFNAKDGTSGRELWFTDGLSANTNMIEISGINELNPTKLIEYNNKLYFFGNNSSGNRRLWASDGTINGTIEISGYPNIISEYKMAVFNDELYFSSNNLYKYQDPSLSINNYALTNEITIYPNPTSTLFRLNSNWEIRKIELYDILGKQVRQFDQDENIYDISDLRDGIYILKVYSDNKKQTLKLIKS